MKPRHRDNGFARNRPLLPWLRGLLPTMNSTRRQIAEVLLNDPERVISLSITELAKISRTSVGSIVQFCKSLGLRGFPALKISLARELAESVLPSISAAQGQHGAPSVLQGIFEKHIESLRQTLQLNTDSTLEAAAEALGKARRIVFFSMGLSYPVAYSLHIRLTFIGLPTSIEYDSYQQFAAAATTQKGEVAIGVSVSGMTRETVECLRLAQARGATTICITNTIDSPLAKTAEIKLYAAPSGVKYFQAALASRVTQLAVADALVAAVALRRKRKALIHFERLEEHMLKRRQTGLQPVSVHPKGRRNLSASSV